MTQPRRTKPLPRRRAPSEDWLDPSSAWVQDEDAVILPITSEPYDWTPDDDSGSSLQVIPVPPPISDSPAKAPKPKRKADIPEASVMIPIEKVTPGQLVRRTGELIRKASATPRRKQMVSSVLLLLLSVIALFIFAYIAQKHGR
ncbi:MAG: hypothetical protein ACREAB_07300 [Blastocatellia bacterium]